MRLRLLLLIFCCVSATGYAQVYEKSYGIEASVHQGGRRISAGSGIPFQQLERQDSLESGLGGYGIGLLFESRADKIGFTAGVRYFTTGYIFTETFADGPGFGTDIESEVTARYLELPLEMNFHQSINEKDRVSFTLGLGANLHLKTETAETPIVEGQRGDTEIIPPFDDEEFRPVVVSLNTALAYDRKLGDDFAVKVQPYFRFFLQGNLQTNFSQFNRNYFQTGVRVVVKRIVF